MTLPISLLSARLSRWASSIRLKSLSESSSQVNVAPETRSSKLHTYALEPRVLLDAAAPTAMAEATVVEVAVEQALLAQANATATSDESASGAPDLISALAEQGSVSDRREIVFIDAAVEDISGLLAELDTSAEVIILDANQDGVEQIAAILQDRTDIDAIHILSHGEEGQLNLGNDVLTIESMQGEHADELAIIRDALSENGDILLYGCDFASGTEGEQAIALLSSLTGADVLASTDVTGAEAEGGDWELEAGVGDVETAALSATNYSGTLNLRPTVDIDADDSGTNPGSFDDVEINVVDGANVNGTLGDATTVSTGFSIERTVLLGVSGDITVDIVTPTGNTLEITLGDDGLSPEANEGVRVVTNLSPSANTNITQLNFSQSPNQDMKAGRITVFFEGNAILHDPDNQISSDADGDIINSTDALVFDNAVAGADATWSLEINNQQLAFEFLFEGENDGTAFGTPAFEVEVVMQEIGFATEFTENDDFVKVTDDVVLTHVDGGDLAQLRINLSGFVDGVEEEINIFGQTYDFTDTRTETINVLGTDLTLSRVNGSFHIDNPAGRITLAQAEAIFETVEYRHVSERPVDGIRMFGFQALDQISGNFRDFSRVANGAVNVVSVNDTPVAIGDGEVRVEAGLPIVLDPIFNDFDLDLDELNILGVPTAIKGTVIVQDDNSIIYTPDADFTGSDTITYTIVDPQGATSTATLTVSDTATNIKPDAGSPQTVDGDENLIAGRIIATLGASDADVDETLIYRISEDPTGGLFAIEGDNLVVAAGATLPNFEALGARTWEVSVRVTDPHADTDIVTITVNFNDLFEEIRGTNNNDTIIDRGDAGDTLIGLNGDDFIQGDTGDNQIHGDSNVVITPNTLRFLEEAVAGVVLATLSATGTEGAVSFAIENDPSGLLEVIGNQIVVAPGAVLPDADTSSTFFPFVVSVTDEVATHTSSFVATLFDQQETIEGTAASEVITDRGTGGDTILGLGGNDRLTGDAGAGTIDGGDGSDIINGGFGADILIGGRGNDQFIYDANDVSIDGGAGSDLVNAAASTEGVNIDLGDYTSIERLIGSPFDDTLNAEDATALTRLDGGVGDDTSIGGSAGDQIFSGSGNDTLIGNGGGDDLRGGTGDDILVGGAGSDTLRGEQGADSFDAGAGTDNIIDYNAVEDVFLDGGDGIDTLTVDGATAINIDLGATNIERVNHSAGFQDSTFDGSSKTDFGVVVTAGSGNDRVLGTNLNDVLIGGAGDDQIEGGEGSDNLTGGFGADTILGGGGRDILSVDENDTFDGGDGIDFVNVATHSDDVNIVLVDHNVEHINVGGLGNDTFDASGLASGSIIRGSAGDDLITGGDFNDSLDGQDDDDIIHGGDGNDTITGGDGADQLFGEAGNDTFNTVNFEDGDTVDGGDGFDLVNLTTDVSQNIDLAALNVEQINTGGTADDVYDGTGVVGNRILVNAGSGEDTILGSVAGDDLRGQDGDDQLFGNEGNDVLRGQNGDDQLFGGEGNDILQAGAGTDTLTGGEGADILQGESGTNILIGGEGNDQHFGGTGIDTVVFSGSRADYSFVLEASGTRIQIIDSVAGRDGTDFVNFYAIEAIQFSDGTVSPSDILNIRVDNAAGDGFFGVAEDAANGTSLGNLVLNQPLTGTLVWSLDSDAGGRFEIDAASGEVTLIDNSNINAEAFAHPSQFFTARVTNGTDTIVQRVFTEFRDVVETITGTANNDLITDQGSGGDTIQGLAGNDTLRGDAGNNTIEGGTGGDNIFGNDGDDILDGGDGNDTLTGGLGADTFITSAGNDHITDFNPLEGDTIVGSVGAGDLISFNIELDGIDVDETTFGTSRIRGTNADDVVSASGSIEAANLTGNGGDDILTGGSANDVIFGGTGNDTITGGAGSDNLQGQNGDDLINAGDGNDTLFGGTGNDMIFGGAGNDNIFAQQDDDVIDGGAGNDTIRGEAGDDTLIGGEGGDNLIGGSGSDSFIPGDGNDTISDFELGVDQGLAGVAGTLDGGDGVDRLILTPNSGALDINLADHNLQRVDSASGDDVLDGSGSLDFGVTLVGNDGDDELIGSQNNDNLIGGDGDDVLTGDDGNDLLTGGRGADELIGGRGTDIFLDYESIDTVLEGGEGDNDEVRVSVRSDDVNIDFAAQGIEFVRNGFGGRGDDVYDATDKIDFNVNVSAGSGDDLLIGSQLNDSLSGQEGDDVLIGGDGGDVLSGGDGADTFDGGEGNDSVNDFHSDDVSIDLGEGTDSVVTAAGSGAITIDLTATSVERFTGATGDDLIDGSGQDVALVITGNAGDDTVFGGSANDIIAIRSGNDTVDGGDGIDEVQVSGLQSEYSISDNGDGTFTIADSVVGRDGVDIVDNVENIRFLGQNLLRPLVDAVTEITIEGDDVLRGGEGNDAIFGNGANDTLFGEAGDDALTGGAGADTLHGGDGLDTAVFSGSFSEYVITDNFNGSITVRDTVAGRDGTDIVFCDAEHLLFSDQTVNSIDFHTSNSLITSSNTAVDAIEGVVHEADLSSGTNQAGAGEVIEGEFTLIVPAGLDSFEITSDLGTVSFSQTELDGATTAAPLLVTSTIGTLRITSFDTGTRAVAYTFTLDGAQDHSGGEVQDVFELLAADLSTPSDSIAGVLRFDVSDDALFAAADADNVFEDAAGVDASASGNVLTGADTAGDSNDTDGVADTFGADSSSEVVSGLALGAGTPDAANVGTALAGMYGEITLNADGSYVYTPDNSAGSVVDQLSGAGSLTETFTYQIQDADGDVVTATLTITILGNNDDPVADDETATVGQAESVVLDLLVGDTDVDTSTLAIQSIDGTAITAGLAQSINVIGGVIDIDLEGVVMFTASSSHLGAAVFDYVVVDSEGGTDVGMVSVDVEFRPDTDGDGITDAFDIDDDNDGILDTREQAGLQQIGDFSDPAWVNFLDRFEINDTSIRWTNDVNNRAQPDGLLTRAVSGLTSLPTISVGGVEYVQLNYEFRPELAARNSNVLFRIRLGSSTIHQIDIPSNVADIPATANRTFGGVIFGGNSASTLAANEDSHIELLIPVSLITSDTMNIQLFVVNNQGASGQRNNFSVDGFGFVLDTDQDGVQNHLDLDSDNDGISDLSESGSGATDANNDGRIDDVADGTTSIAGDTDQDGASESVRGPELVTNGRFDGDAVGWTINGSAGYFGNRGFINGGNRAADGNLSQTLTTIVGQTYEVNFTSDTNGGASGVVSFDFFVRDGAGLAGSTIVSDSVSLMAGGTGENTLRFIASSSQTTIVFEDTTAPGANNLDVLIDNVSAVALGSSPVNTDNDGIDDYLDLDSDNDGIADTIEAFPTAILSADTDLTDNDSDGDGIVDRYDSNDGDGAAAVFGGSFTTPLNTDAALGAAFRDGTPDYLDADSDGDGILDSIESGLTLSGADANNDGIDDDATIGASYADPNGVINNPSTDLDNQFRDQSEVGFREINGPPIAQANAYATNEDTAGVIGNALTDTDAVTGADSDPDNDALTVTPQTDSAGSTGGLFSVDSAGVVTFDPNGDFDSLAVGESATTTLTYEINDGEGGTDTAAIRVTVAGVNDRPEIIDSVTGRPFPGSIDPTTGLPIDPVSGLPIQPVGPQSGADNVAITPINVGSLVRDPDSTDVLDFSVTGLPTGLSIDSMTGLIAGNLDPSASQGGVNSDGVYTVEVITTDSNGGEVISTFTYSVGNPLPIAENNAYTTDEDTGGVIGNALTDADATAGTDTDPDGDTLSVTPQTDAVGSTGGLFSIDGAGVVTFDPNGEFESLAVGESATTTLTYAIIDSEGGTDTATIRVTVEGVNDRPVIIDPATGLPYPGPVDRTTGLPIDPITNLPVQPIGPETGNDGAAITPIDVNSLLIDPDSTDVLSFSTAGLPAGLMIDPVTGIITGTPEASASQGGPNGDGVYTVEVTIVDSNGGVVVSSFTYTLANAVPIAEDNAYEVNEDRGSAVIGNALTDDDATAGIDTDSDGDALSVTPQTDVAGSTGGIFSIDSAGVVIFDPNSEFESLAVGETATTTLTYEISDGEDGTDTAVIAVTIEGVNDRAVVIDSATGLPFPGPVDPTAGLPISPVTGLPIQPIGPEIGADNVAITPIDVGSLLTDPDSTDVLSFSAAGLPLGLMIDPVRGIIAGTLDASASQGGPNSDGVYRVEVTVVDSNGGEVIAAFTYAVSNPVVTAQDNAYDVGEDDGSAVIGNALTDIDPVNGADSDPDGDSLSVTPQMDVVGSTGGLFSIDSAGVVTFDPNGEFESLAVGETAITTLTYEVSDGEGGIDTATIGITVEGFNDRPEVLDPITGNLFSGSTDPASGLPFDPATGLLIQPIESQAGSDNVAIIPIDVGSLLSDPDSTDALEFRAIGLPRGLSIDSITGLITGILDPSASQGGPNSDGEYRVEVTTTDSNGGTLISSFTYSAENLAPIAQNNEYALTNSDDDQLVGNLLTDETGQSVDTDPDGDSLSVTPQSMLVGSNGGVFSIDSSGQVIFSANEDFNDLTPDQTRTTTVTYQISDGQGGFDTATLTLTISGSQEIVYLEAPVLPLVDQSNSNAVGDKPIYGEGSVVAMINSYSSLHSIDDALAFAELVVGADTQFARNFIAELKPGYLYLRMESQFQEAFASKDLKFTEYQVTLADGHALPEWMVYHNSNGRGLLLVLIPPDESNVTLWVTALGKGDDIARFELDLSLVDGAIELREMTSKELVAPKLFSDHIGIFSRNDDELIVALQNLPGGNFE